MKKFEDLWMSEVEKENFNKKSKVRIKTWADMVDEFGLDLDLDNQFCIRAKYAWLQDMEAALPEDRIIEVEIADNCLEWNVGECNWCISEDMIAERL